MKEHPILFSTPMVRAILAGRKTVTRRVFDVKRARVTVHKAVHADAPFGIDLSPGVRPCLPGKPYKIQMNPHGAVSAMTSVRSGRNVTPTALGLRPSEFQWQSPYGVAGDHLWVRETWNNSWTDHPIYKANGGSAIAEGYEKEPRWHPSIHMPRAVSRITLRVTGVKVERLRAITEDQAKAEGVDPNHPTPAANFKDPIHTFMFRDLWNSINAKRGFGWDTNPWVWAISFERVT